jgi:hypothetical protein
MCIQEVVNQDPITKEPSDGVERGARIRCRGHMQRGRGVGLGRVVRAWHETRSR